MLRRLTRRPLRTAACFAASSLSLMACSPSTEITPRRPPATCAAFLEDYRIAQQATSYAAEAQRSLLNGVITAIRQSGYRIYDLRDGMGVIIEPHVIGQIREEGRSIDNTSLDPITLATDTASIPLQNGGTQTERYRLLLALRHDAVTNSDFGLVAAADQQTIIVAGAAGAVSTPETALTPAMRDAMPPALRDLGNVMLPAQGNTPAMTLAQHHAMLAPYIVAQQRLAARHFDAVEQEFAQHPAKAERCARFG